MSCSASLFYGSCFFEALHGWRTDKNVILESTPFANGGYFFFLFYSSTFVVHVLLPGRVRFRDAELLVGEKKEGPFCLLAKRSQMANGVGSRKKSLEGKKSAGWGGRVGKRFVCISFRI